MGIAIQAMMEMSAFVIGSYYCFIVRCSAALPTDYDNYRANPGIYLHHTMSAHFLLRIR